MTTLGILTDIHVSQPGTPPIRWHDDLSLGEAGERFSTALSTLAQHEPDAIVVLGDLAHLGDNTSLDEFVDRSDAVGLPVLAVPGNHDILESPNALAAALQRRAPLHVAEATTCVSMIESTTVLGVGVADAVGEHRYESSAHPSRSGPAVVLSHFPAISFFDLATSVGLRYAGDLVDQGELESVLTADPSAVVVLSGHLHLRAARSSGQMLQLCFGALVEPPFDLALATIDLDGPNSRVAVDFLGDEHDVPPVQLPPRVEYIHGINGWTEIG
ncbi:MAG: metallophosphoesterase family protein [Ilumatobacter sp.]|uniref:metallophosphoesterase family protein n=1 Tax=Ilumatobacter sp. TaxID=1967498 RepID=UPI00391C215E